MLAIQFVQAKFVVISKCELVEFLETYKVYGMTTSEIDIPDAVPEQQGQHRSINAMTSICSLATTTHGKYVDGVKSRIQCKVERYLRRKTLPSL